MTDFEFTDPKPTLLLKPYPKAKAFSDSIKGNKISPEAQAFLENEYNFLNVLFGFLPKQYSSYIGGVKYTDMSDPGGESKTGGGENVDADKAEKDAKTAKDYLAQITELFSFMKGVNPAVAGGFDMFKYDTSLTDFNSTKTKNTGKKFFYSTDDLNNGGIDLSSGARKTVPVFSSGKFFNKSDIAKNGALNYIDQYYYQNRGALVKDINLDGSIDYKDAPWLADYENVFQEAVDSFETGEFKGLFKNKAGEPMTVFEIWTSDEFSKDVPFKDMNVDTGKMAFNLLVVILEKVRQLTTVLNRYVLATQYQGSMDNLQTKGKNYDGKMDQEMKKNFDQMFKSALFKSGGNYNYNLMYAVFANLTEISNFLKVFVTGKADINGDGKNDVDESVAKKAVRFRDFVVSNARGYASKMEDVNILGSLNETSDMQEVKAYLLANSSSILSNMKIKTTFWQTKIEQLKEAKKDDEIAAIVFGPRVSFDSDAIKKALGPAFTEARSKKAVEMLASKNINLIVNGLIQKGITTVSLDDFLKRFKLVDSGRQDGVVLLSDLNLKKDEDSDGAKEALVFNRLKRAGFIEQSGKIKSSKDALEITEYDFMTIKKTWLPSDKNEVARALFHAGYTGEFDAQGEAKFLAFSGDLDLKKVKKGVDPDITANWDMLVSSGVIDGNGAIKWDGTSELNIADAQLKSRITAEFTSQINAASKYNGNSVLSEILKESKAMVDSGMTDAIIDGILIGTFDLTVEEKTAIYNAISEAFKDSNCSGSDFENTLISYSQDMSVNSVDSMLNELFAQEDESAKFQNGAFGLNGYGYTLGNYPAVNDSNYPGLSGGDGATALDFSKFPFLQLPGMHRSFNFLSMKQWVAKVEDFKIKKSDVMDALRALSIDPVYYVTKEQLSAIPGYDANDQKWKELFEDPEAEQLIFKEGAGAKIIYLYTTPNTSDMSEFGRALLEKYNRTQAVIREYAEYFVVYGATGKLILDDLDSLTFRPDFIEYYNGFDLNNYEFANKLKKMKDLYESVGGDIDKKLKNVEMNSYYKWDEARKAWTQVYDQGSETFGNPYGDSWMAYVLSSLYKQGVDSLASALLQTFFDNNFARSQYNRQYDEWEQKKAEHEMKNYSIVKEEREKKLKDQMAKMMISRTQSMHKENQAEENKRSEENAAYANSLKKRPKQAAK